MNLSSPRLNDTENKNRVLMDLKNNLKASGIGSKSRNLSTSQERRKQEEEIWVLRDEFKPAESDLNQRKKSNRKSNKCVHYAPFLAEG